MMLAWLAAQGYFRYASPFYTALELQNHVDRYEAYCGGELPDPLTLTFCRLSAAS